MATKVIMPKQGLQMTEGVILQWFKKEGEAVKEGDPLFEMETDKLTIEIVAPGSGKLLRIFNHEGDTVPITELIAVIGEEGEDISALEAEKGGSGGAAKPAASKPAAADQSAEKAPVQPLAGGSPKGGSAAGPASEARAPGERVFSSPRARMRAEERGVTLDAVPGTGPEGLVIERDVLSAQPSASGAAATPLAKKAAQQGGIDLDGVTGSGPRGKIYSRDLAGAAGAADTPMAEPVRTPLKGMRKVIAERMRSSLDTAAQAVHNVDVDMTEAVRMRESLKEAGIKISYNDIILKTAAAALKKMPAMNRSLQGSELITYSNINIGIAVALDEGLIVPVMNNVDLRSLEQINAESGRLGELAKTGGLTSENLSGATFTVSNLGMYGLDRFTAIINEPESGILAVGAIKDKAVAVNKEVVVRPVCSLTLTYDHRVIDGAPAAEFLMLIKTILENPYRLI